LSDQIQNKYVEIVTIPSMTTPPADGYEAEQEHGQGRARQETTELEKKEGIRLPWRVETALSAFCFCLSSCRSSLSTTFCSRQTTKPHQHGNQQSRAVNSEEEKAQFNRLQAITFMAATQPTGIDRSFVAGAEVRRRAAGVSSAKLLDKTGGWERKNGICLRR
jgi:hypothetical protein